MTRGKRVDDWKKRVDADWRGEELVTRG